MKNEPTTYGVYLCESFVRDGKIQLSDIRPIRLEDEGKEGQTKTVKIYPFEADILNDGIGRVAKWTNAAKKDNPVYLTEEQFKELAGREDESLVKEAPKKAEVKKGRPKKETKIEK
tara:strand:+ start:161 stop:508 length:348 start_codon:yes stop_codon:yes gene_type:complete